ncbi:hypothetical protein Tco_1073505 [Tanacetum coccineum]
MDTEEVNDRYVAPCFVNGLEAYDVEINLGVEENMISNEFALKLCLEHELRHRNKVGIVDFGNETVTIYPELDPFLDSAGEEEKIGDDWDLLLDDLDFGDILDIEGVKILPFEEAEREALAIGIYERYSLLEEERPVIENMVYSDKYKKILDGICLDKMKLDGEMKTRNYDVEPFEGRAYRASEGCPVPRLAQLLPRLTYSPCVVDWNVLNNMGCGETIDEMLTIKLLMAGTNEEIFTSEAWTNAFNIDEPIYSELYHEFYSTYELH